MNENGPVEAIPLKPAVEAVDLKLACGGCFWGRSTVMDLKAPIQCRRYPPQRSAFPMPTPQGIQVIEHCDYPRVSRETPACGEFRARFQS